MNRNAKHLVRLVKRANGPGLAASRPMPAHVSRDPNKAERWNNNRLTLQENDPYKAPTWGDFAEEFTNPTTPSHRESWSKTSPFVLKPLTYGAGGVVDMAKAVVRSPFQLTSTGAELMAQGRNKWDSNLRNASQSAYDNYKGLIRRSYQNAGLYGPELEKAVNTDHAKFMRDLQAGGNWDDFRPTFQKGWDQFKANAFGQDNGQNWSGMRAGAKDMLFSPQVSGAGNAALGSALVAAGVTSALTPGAAGSLYKTLGSIPYAGKVIAPVASVAGLNPKYQALRAYDDVAVPALAEVTGRDFSIPGMVTGAAKGTFGRKFNNPEPDPATQIPALAPAPTNIAGETFSPTDWLNLLAWLRPYIDRQQQQQAAQQPNYANSAIARAADRVYQT